MRRDRRSRHRPQQPRSSPTDHRPLSVPRCSFRHAMSPRLSQAGDLGVASRNIFTFVLDGETHKKGGWHVGTAFRGVAANRRGAEIGASPDGRIRVADTAGHGAARPGRLYTRRRRVHRTGRLRRRRMRQQFLLQPYRNQLRGNVSAAVWLRTDLQYGRRLPSRSRVLWGVRLYGLWDRWSRSTQLCQQLGLQHQ